MMVKRVIAVIAAAALSALPTVSSAYEDDLVNDIINSSDASFEAAVAELAENETESDETEVTAKDFSVNTSYDKVLLNNNFDDEETGNSPDGTAYKISDGTYRLWDKEVSGMNFGESFFLSADVMYTLENKKIEFRNDGNNIGAAVYVSGNKLLNAKSSSGNQTLYGSMKMNSWYRMEFEGRMGVSGAVTEFRLYEYGEDGTAKLVSTVSPLQLRNFWAGNNKFPGFALVGEGICIDNEYAVREYPDEVVITEETDENTIDGGGSLRFSCVAARNGVSENITQPDFVWEVCGVLPGEEEYIKITEDGRLTVLAQASEQEITVKATANSNGNPYGEYKVTVLKTDLSNEKFTAIKLDGSLSVAAGESAAYSFTATKNGVDVTETLEETDVLWYVYNSTGSRELNNRFVKLDNGILSVDESVIGQKIVIRAASVSGFVYDDIAVEITSTSSESVINENACEEYVEGVLVKQGSWDGSAYYMKDSKEDFLGSGSQGNVSGAGDYLISADLKFEAATGSGITTVRRDGGMGFCLVSHNGALAAQTGNSAYTDLKTDDGNPYTLDEQSWYHIEFMFSTAAPSLNIWRYDNDGNRVEKATFTAENGMIFRSKQGFNRIKLNAETGLDNYRVLKPRATSIELLSDMSEIEAGQTMTLKPAGKRDGLYMANMPLSEVSWSVYDSENVLPSENESISVTAGVLSVYGLTAPQKIYVRATSVYDKRVYASLPIDIVNGNVIEVVNVGVDSENENKLVKIMVSKTGDYSNDVTFLVSFYDANGGLVGAYSKRVNGKNLKNGDNEVAVDYILPSTFDKESGTAKVFVLTSMSVNESGADVSAGFKAMYEQGVLRLEGIDNMNGKLSAAVYKKGVSDSELSGDLDGKLIYAFVGDKTAIGNMYIPNLPEGEYVAAIGGAVNGEYRVCRAEFKAE